VSAHLEKHRAAYYDSLMAVRTRGDLGQWIRFFLVAIIETARRGVETFQKIHQLRNTAGERVTTLGARSANARRALDYLYQKPIVTGGELCRRLGISQPTVDRLLVDLVRLDILQEMTGKQRNREFCFRDYYRLFIE
jgi:Fic family protein